MKGKKIFWGIFFILAAVLVVISKLGIVPDIGVFTILVTAVLACTLIEGVRHLNFFEILFSIAFLCIVYDKPLGIEALTPWTVLAAALFGSIGLSMLFRGEKTKDGREARPGIMEITAVIASSAMANTFSAEIILVRRSVISIPIISAMHIWKTISEH